MRGLLNERPKMFLINSSATFFFLDLQKKSESSYNFSREEWRTMASVHGEGKNKFSGSK